MPARRAPITEEELGAIEQRACPGGGACAGMFTANTMASAAEALGMSPPRAPPRRRPSTVAARTTPAPAAAVVRLLELGITPRRILTKAAFENAIAVVNALGGSTNAVLHLLAIANEAGVPSPSTTSTASRHASPTSPT